MDGFFANTSMGEDSGEDSMLGDNAMGVARGASFLLKEDPNKDPVKPMGGSLGDAPMGEKPKELNPLGDDPLGLLSGVNPFGNNIKPDTSFGGDTNVARPSALGPNPLGDDPLGLLSGVNPFGNNMKPDTSFGGGSSEDSFGTFGLNPPGISALDEISMESAMEILKKAEKPKEAPLGDIISIDDDFGDGALGGIISSLSDPSAHGSGIISSDTSFGSGSGAGEASLEAEVFDGIVYDDGANSSLDSSSSFYNLGGMAEEDEDFRPLGDNVEEDYGGSASSQSEQDLSDDADSQPQDKAAKEEMDPLKALLLAGGNPFGDNASRIKPDLSFGKESLVPKHFEPMKASRPKVSAENVQANKPLGDKPFGKEIAPDRSFGKEALQPGEIKPSPMRDLQAEGPRLGESQIEKPQAEGSGIMESRIEKLQAEGSGIMESQIEKLQAEEPRLGETRNERPQAEEQRLGESRNERPQAEEQRIVETRNERPQAEEQRIVESRNERPQAEEQRIGESRIERPQVEEQRLVEARIERPQAEEQRIGESRIVEPQAKKSRALEASFDNETTVASASMLGPNPLGPDPLGLNTVGGNTKAEIGEKTTKSESSDTGRELKKDNPLGPNPLGSNPLGLNPLGDNPFGGKNIRPDNSFGAQTPAKTGGSFGSNTLLKPTSMYDGEESVKPASPSSFALAHMTTQSLYDDLNEPEEEEEIVEDSDERFCPECGMPMMGRDSFCNRCGKKVEPIGRRAYERLKAKKEAEENAKNNAAKGGGIRGNGGSRSGGFGGGSHGHGGGRGSHGFGRSPVAAPWYEQRNEKPIKKIVLISTASVAAVVVILVAVLTIISAFKETVTVLYKQSETEGHAVTETLTFYATGNKVSGIKDEYVLDIDGMDQDQIDFYKRYLDENYAEIAKASFIDYSLTVNGGQMIMQLTYNSLDSKENMATMSEMGIYKLGGSRTETGRGNFIALKQTISNMKRAGFAESK